jgi:hypothetical protein
MRIEDAFSDLGFSRKARFGKSVFEPSGFNISDFVRCYYGYKRRGGQHVIYSQCCSPPLIFLLKGDKIAVIIRSVS